MSTCSKRRGVGVSLGVLSVTLGCTKNASSAIPDTEATSAAPFGWVQGGGTSPLNQALLDVQAMLQAEGDAIQNCTKAHLASRAAVPVCFILTLFFLVLLCGGAPAHPLGVVPEFRAGC